MTDIHEIRAGVVGRIERLAHAHKDLRVALEVVDGAGETIHEVWKDWPHPSYTDKYKGCRAITYFIQSEADKIREDINAAVQQFTMLFVRDVIGEALKASPTPVVELTGNSYMPPIRSFDEVERLWQLDDGEVWEMFSDNFDARINESTFIVGCPDYDNALYGVDTSRWHFTDTSEDPNAWLDDSNYQTSHLERG